MRTDFNNGNYRICWQTKTNGMNGIGDTEDHYSGNGHYMFDTENEAIQYKKRLKRLYGNILNMWIESKPE